MEQILMSSLAAEVDYVEREPLRQSSQLGLSLTASASAMQDVIERDGYCALEDAICPETLTELRHAIDRLASRYGDQNVSLMYPADTDEGFRLAAENPRIAFLMRSLTGRQDAVPLSVLRVIYGTHDQGASAFAFHYDASTITVLIPIIIPRGEPDQAGDFVCFPNLRPIRKSVLVNLVDKVRMQNSKARDRFAARASAGEGTIIKMRPGAAYLFAGYRTFHANFPVAPDERRATLILHMGDPHQGSFFTSAIKATRRWRVARALRNR